MVNLIREKALKLNGMFKTSRCIAQKDVTIDGLTEEAFFMVDESQWHWLIYDRDIHALINYLLKHSLIYTLDKKDIKYFHQTDKGQRLAWARKVALIRDNRLKKESMIDKKLHG